MKKVARSARRWTAAELSLTPMIDVVFLLLVFFVMAVHPDDILAQIGVSRPGTDGSAGIPLLRIDVRSDGYTMNGKRVDIERMDTYLAKIADLSPQQTIVIACESESSHSQLVKVLDLCAKSELENLALFSR